MIQGNLIGTDVTGTVALGNSNNGITFSIDPSNNTIGGAAPGAGNVISANAGKGISFFGSGNVVQGNFIGTDITGTAGLGNGEEGIFFWGSSNNIGGTAPGAGNVISANTGIGLSFNGSGNVVQGNFIGTDITGTANLGNGDHGLRPGWVSGGTIGGTVAGAGNTIAYNSSNGVEFPFNFNTVFISVLGNSIFENTGIGIDLGGNGPTANDPGDGDGPGDGPGGSNGPNKLQNFPDLTNAFISGGGDLHLTYSIDTDLANATYPLTVEFFEADADDQEGQTFLGRDTYTTTNHSGCGAPPCQKTVTLDSEAILGVAAMDHLVATATDDDGNTSEFSASHITGPIMRYVATDGSDVGDCTNSLDPCASPAYAIGQANNGDIIDLAAGAYSAPSFAIDKILIIQGQGVVVQ